jgi:uroporphyrinogen-III synthase
MTFTAPLETRPLYGCKVLIPRGGPWGDFLASALRSKGATPVIAPMINFETTDDVETLQSAFEDLAAGKFDWVTMTSATTVDVMAAYGAVIPATTRVAAVGETTASALRAAGYKADLVPSEENTAHGLLESWSQATKGIVPLRILTLRSQIAVPVLTEGLKRIGHNVRSVVAYRTVGVPVDDAIIRQVREGDFNAVLVTSGSAGEQIALQIGDIPSSTLVAAIGPRTAKDARAFGLRVDSVAPEQDVDSLLRLLIANALASSK